MKFDPNHWSKLIKDPRWYLEFQDFMDQARLTYRPDSDEFKSILRDSRHFFEEALLDGRVALASSGIDLDEERQPIDTIVIHHTSAAPGYRLSYMNAVHLLNIYVPYFANPTMRSQDVLRGQPIWSSHIYGGKPVFWVYHWFMLMDGSFIRLLPDEAIGWQAGNWDINCRSVAICIDNDYERQNPDEEVLKKLAAFIKKQYPQVVSSQVIGHCEANPQTICPGTNFSSVWKPKLLDYVRHAT